MGIVYPETMGVPLEEMDAVFGEGIYYIYLIPRIIQFSNLSPADSGKENFAMQDYSERVALVGRGEHDNDDDDATLAPAVPRKDSREDASLIQKPYTSSLRDIGHGSRGNSRGGSHASSYASLVDDDED